MPLPDDFATIHTHQPDNPANLPSSGDSEVVHPSHIPTTTTSELTDKAVPSPNDDLLNTGNDTKPESISKPEHSFPIPFPIQVSPMVVIFQLIGILLLSNLALSVAIALIGAFGGGSLQIGNFSTTTNNTADNTTIGTALSASNGIGSLVLFILNLARVGFTGYLIIYVISRALGTVYFVRDGNLIRRKGLITTTETSYSITDLQQVRISQNSFGRFLNYGTVILTFRVAFQPLDLILPGIQDPHQVAAMFTPYV